MKIENQPWRFLDHTADIRMEVSGKSLSDLFLNAARGFSEILGAGEPVTAETSREVSFEASSPEELLVDWLREILYENQTHGFVFAGAEISEASADRFAAILFLGPCATDCEPDLEIKAVTYHGLTVERTDSGYLARIVFDI